MIGMPIDLTGRFMALQTEKRNSWIAKIRQQEQTNIPNHDDPTVYHSWDSGHNLNSHLGLSKLLDY